MCAEKGMNAIVSTNSWIYKKQSNPLSPIICRHSVNDPTYIHSKSSLQKRIEDNQIKRVKSLNNTMDYDSYYIIA